MAFPCRGLKARPAWPRSRSRACPDLERIAAALEQTLPAYARPLFLRLVESFEATETFKQKKGGLAAEGFDPSLIADPLFVAVAGRYQPLTSEIHADIQSGGCASKVVAAEPKSFKSLMVFYMRIHCPDGDDGFSLHWITDLPSRAREPCRKPR